MADDTSIATLDNIRGFFNEKIDGRFSKSHPLQSALLVSMYCDDDDSKDIIEDSIVDYFGRQVSEASNRKKRLHAGNSDLISSVALKNLRMSSSSKSINISKSPYSMHYGLELASDLLMIEGESDGGTDATLQRGNYSFDSLPAAIVNAPPIIPVPPVVVRNMKTTSTQTIAAPVAPVTVAVVAPEKKKGSFQSGKDKFLEDGGKFTAKATFGQSKTAISSSSNKDDKNEIPLPPELEHCDRALVEKIEAEIVHTGQVVTFEEIAGLEFAKKCVDELICWPMTRPDLFKGLRSLPKGLLLFGPPGTGKTLIGKAIAHQAGATFFSISASSLTSKWIGEGEKTVRTLFAVAGYRQPSVVFIDEVDSLLCQRSSDENEASRRIKTEFLVQLDGAGTDQTARVVIVGATNRPEELDEAARRRFVKRIYIPLPDVAGRKQLFSTLMKGSDHSLIREDLDVLVHRTDGFSGADVRSLCTEAAMGPVREIAMRHGDLLNVQADDVPPISRSHFQDAFDAVAPSVSPADLQRYVDWNGTFGSFRRMI